MQKCNKQKTILDLEYIWFLHYRYLATYARIGAKSMIKIHRNEQTETEREEANEYNAFEMELCQFD